MRVGDTSDGDTSTGDTRVNNKIIVFTAKIISGSQKGQIIKASQTLDGSYAVIPVVVKVNSKVILMPAQGDDKSNGDWAFDEFIRSNNLVIFGALFFILLLLFGRKKGFNTIVSLIFTCLSIFIVFVPALLSGYNIYLTTAVICLFIVLMSILYVTS